RTRTEDAAFRKDHRQFAADTGATSGSPASSGDATQAATDRRRPLPPRLLLEHARPFLPRRLRSHLVRLEAGADERARRLEVRGRLSDDDALPPDRRRGPRSAAERDEAAQLGLRARVQRPAWP